MAEFLVLEQGTGVDPKTITNFKISGANVNMFTFKSDARFMYTLEAVPTSEYVATILGLARKDEREYVTWADLDKLVDSSMIPIAPELIGLAPEDLKPARGW